MRGGSYVVYTCESAQHYAFPRICCRLLSIHSDTDVYCSIQFCSSLSKVSRTLFSKKACIALGC